MKSLNKKRNAHSHTPKEQVQAFVFISFQGNVKHNLHVNVNDNNSFYIQLFQTQNILKRDLLNLLRPRQCLESTWMMQLQTKSTRMRSTHQLTVKGDGDGFRQMANVMVRCMGFLVSIEIQDLSLTSDQKVLIFFTCLHHYNGAVRP